MNARLRVAMIIHSYHPRVGGAEQQLMAIAPLLQARSVDVHILTRRYPGLAAYEMVNGVPVHRLSIPGPKPVASLSFTVAALPLLRKLRPNVIHAYDMRSPATTAIAAKRLLNVPVAVKVLRGGAMSDFAALRSMPFGARRLASFVKQIDAFVTISQEIEAELDAYNVPSSRRHFIPNGVDTTRFAPLAPDEKRTLRTRLGLLDVPTVIFTGRLAPEKRVQHLLAVWPTVRKHYPDATLLLLGAGPEEAMLRQQASPGVQFLGLQQDVTPYLQAADVFVLPSATEGLSNALLEALATGLPALVTAVGGAPDVIEHQRHGWLIGPDDVPALEAALLTLLGDPELRARLSANGRERIVQEYALSVTADRLRTMYDTLMRPAMPQAGALKRSA